MINLEKNDYQTKENKIRFLKENSQYLDKEDLDILNLIEGGVKNASR